MAIVRWCLSQGSLGSARPLSSMPFWRRPRGPTGIFGSDAASVSTTMVRERPTFRCSRPSGGLRAGMGRALIPLLRRQAPTWLVQIPASMEEAEREALSRQLFGSTQERMARELAGALEALTAERPLVLWLEDLHWSDLSTVDALAMLARRREPARLLVVGHVSAGGGDRERASVARPGTGARGARAVQGLAARVLDTLRRSPNISPPGSARRSPRPRDSKRGGGSFTGHRRQPLVHGRDGGRSHEPGRDRRSVLGSGPGRPRRRI